MAARLTPDVVLMDINMPDMDGIAATERLAAEVPTAAVVMMSVQGEADYLRRSMLAGAREFLVKPFCSDELTSSIRQVYTREREKLSRIALQAAAAGGAARGQGRQPAGARGRRARPRRRGVRPQGRRRPDDPRRQPGGRRGHRAGPAHVPRGRLVPVRRRGRPAQPQPQEQVHRGPHPGAGERRGRVARHVPHQPLRRHPRPAGPAVAGDGRAHHAAWRQAHDRDAAHDPRPGGRGLHVVLQRHHPRHPRSRRHRPHDAVPRDHVASRTSASSWRWPSSSGTGRTRSGWS